MSMRPDVAIRNQLKRTHNMSESSEFRIWAEMRARCERKSHAAYGDYGGRGITVCDSWRESFERFYADMGPRPAGMTLERIDNDQGYALGNCRWATRTEQNNNKRNNRLLTAFGKTKTLATWMRELAPRITPTSIANRLNRGWSIERALSEPTRRIKC